ncbi:MAG: glycine cleavage system aminomethyltransferase GcvT [archaeon GB-1867-005]|nr:glycine cleavage system aminomethyltransferase GcvT [Candidatus Culexmicrobium cathedralense]
MRKTHLHDHFVAKGAKMVDFAGWHMPLWFESIIKEHLAVRNAVGIFDVTHMGRMLITGKDSCSFLQYVTTNNVEKLKVKRLHYSTICNPSGGIKDDIMLLRLEEEKYLLICNASNREKIFNWLKQHAEKYQVQVENISDEVPMFALQGPLAEKTLQKLVEADLSKLKHWRLTKAKILGVEAVISRSGYTGEDGFEITLWRIPLSEAQKAVEVYEAILEAGKEYGIAECGLGARDTLRLEAGLVLYGNDIDEATTPLEAKLEWVVKFEKGEFIGREALMKQAEEGLKRIRVGLKMIDRGIPRQHYEIYSGEEKIGTITSGTYSPLLKVGIAMGYVKPQYAEPKTQVEVVIRGKRAKAEIVDWPFYDPTAYGRRRVKK